MHVLKIGLLTLKNEASFIFRNYSRYPKIQKFYEKSLYIITFLHKNFGGIWRKVY
jgi:hypothetical protein